MAYDLTTMSEVLDDLRAPLQNILGKKVRTREWMAKSRIPAAGKRVLQPVIVADDAPNAGEFSWIGDGGAIATDTTGEPVELIVPFRFFARRLRVTGPTEAAAGESKSQMEDAVQFAMEHFTDSLVSTLNRDAWSGGRVLGFIHERKSVGIGGQWEFTGDIQKADDLLDADPLNPNTAYNVTLFNVRTGATIAGGPWSLSAADVDTGLITLQTALDTTVGGAGGIVAADAGHAIAVATAAGTVNTRNLDREPKGILGNLGDQDHFGLNRSVAANAIMRSNVFTMANSGAHDRADISLRRIQSVLDRISDRTRGAGRPNRGFFHPTQREVMSTLFNAAATLKVDVQSNNREVDGGFTGFSYGGIKFEEDVDCPRGMLAMFQDNTWSRYELRGGDWKRNDSGSISYVVQGVDAREAVWTEYVNAANFGPNFSGAIVGLTAVGLDLV